MQKESKRFDWLALRLFAARSVAAWPLAALVGQLLSWGDVASGGIPTSPADIAAVGIVFALFITSLVSLVVEDEPSSRGFVGDSLWFAQHLYWKLPIRAAIGIVALVLSLGFFGLVVAVAVLVVGGVVGLLVFGLKQLF